MSNTANRPRRASERARRSRAARAALGALALAILFAVLAAPSALAGTVTNDRPLLFSFDGGDSSVGPFTYTGAVASDESSGDVYVINLAGTGKGPTGYGSGPTEWDDERALCKFNAEGEAQNFTAGESAGKSCLDGKETPSGAFGVEGFFGVGASRSDVAVDNSGGSGRPGEGEQGRLYVSEEPGPIHAFAPSGAYLWTLPSQFNVCGLAVDTAGHLWVGAGDFGEGEVGEKVLEFASSGSPPAQIGEFATTHGSKRPCRLAVDKSGQDIYVGLIGNSGRGVDKYVSGLYDSSLATGFEAVGLTIDQSKSSGHIFTVFGGDGAEYEPCATPGCPGTAVASSPFGGDLLSRGLRGIAYNPSKDRVYVSDLESDTIKVFGPVTSGPVPDVSCGAADEITRTKATAHCTINPQGLANAYHFEYRHCENEACNGSRDVSARWATAKSACESSAPEDSSDHALPCTLEALRRSAWYQVRLVGANAEAGKNLISAYSSPDTFKTLPPPSPAVVCDPVSAITTSSAHLACTIDPQEDQTTWRVLRSAQPEASEAQCKALGESAFTKVKEGTIPTGEPGSVGIAADLTGLLPAQTNCVRVTATNANPVPGVADKVFITKAVKPTELETAFAAPRTDTTARINGRVNPEGETDFSYRFELSTDGVNWTPRDPRESSVDAWERIVVADELTGLQPDTTYHYRLASAENEAGPVAGGPGDPRTFTTRSAAEMALPPNAFGEAEKRGVELVNSPDDGNQNVRMLTFASSPITADGEKAVWDVNSGAPGAPNAARNAFLAERTGPTESAPNGWSSRPVAPPAEQQYGGGAFTPFPLTATPDLSQFAALYTSEREQVLARLDSARNQQLLRLFPNGGVDQKAIDISDDGAHVLIQNPESGQIEDDGNGSPEVVSLMLDGTESACHMAGEGSSFMGTTNGGGGAGRYWRPGYQMISTTDASRVYFQVKPNGSGCGAGVPLALYVRNREANKGKGKTTLIDPGMTSPTSASEPHFIRATPDGRVAYFLTAGKCRKYQQKEPKPACEEKEAKDKNEHEDVYRWDEASGKSTCLTCEMHNEAGETVTDANPASANLAVAVSDDFSHAYFESEEALAPGAFAGGRNIYALSGGALRFVANVSKTESAAGAVASSELSTDGNVLVFRAVAQPGLTADAVAPQCTVPGGAPIACKKLYRYDDRDGSLECLDCAHGALSSHASPGDSAKVSADGGTVAFTTPEALLRLDVNRDNDVYEWREGALRLITDGLSDFSNRAFAAPSVAAVDGDGSDVFFTVAAPGLTGFEHSGLANAYDARIGGGFTPPSPPAHCTEDSCQGPLQASPPANQPNSSTYSGPGNVKEGPHKPPCRRGKVRRHGRCVTRRHLNHRRHRRAPRANRGRAR